jgi:hypothetical protein
MRKIGVTAKEPTAGVNARKIRHFANIARRIEQAVSLRCVKDSGSYGNVVSQLTLIWGGAI